MSNADGTLVLATYGTVSSEFGAFDSASWLTTSYSLAAAALQPLAGKLSDIYGRKGIIIISYTLFTAGALVTGTAQSMWQIIAGRILGGFGAAGMTVLVSILITDLVPLIQVAAWRSYVNVVATTGRSIGGPLGGFLADTVGWRWSFIAQGPVMLVAIALVALKLPGDTSAKNQTKGQPSKLRRIDFVGALLVALTISSLLGALSLGGQNLPWSHPIVIGLGLGSIILGSIFVTYEIRYALEPVFPPLLLLRRDVVTSYAISALQSAAQLGMMFSVPLYFQVTQEASIAQAGSYLFPAVLGNTVGTIIAGIIIQKTGRYKRLVTLATTASSLSYLTLILRWKGKISVFEALEIIPSGFGTGMVQATAFIALTSSLEHKEIAMATSGMYLITSIGMVTGIAVSSAVQQGGLRALLLRALHGPDSGKIIERVISDVSTLPKLDSTIREIVVASYVKSIEYSHMVSLGCSLTALIISLVIREHPLK
ncbi:major facilitator superfamily domain-containing protein [Xylogone sp. PMI_703]|nr:major facilitator superfamily domain-containing protein [Xylogone sp. PMI_703]